MNSQIEVGSRIITVDVFRTSALITRRAEIVTAGRSGRFDVRMGGLPLLLIEDSVRARLGDASVARIVDLRMELHAQPRERPLDTAAEEELRKLLHAKLSAEVDRLRERDRIRLLESLMPAAYKATELPAELAFAGRHPVGAWLQLGDYVQEELVATRSLVRSFDRKLESLEDEIARARDCLHRQSRAESESFAPLRRAALLHIELKAAAPALEVELSYLTPAARWLPQYELRVYEDRGVAEFGLKAMVAQCSGENWEKAAMAFATADLRRSAALPELESWRIGKQQSLKPSGWKEIPNSLAELFEGYDRGILPIPSPETPIFRLLPDMPSLEAGSTLPDSALQETLLQIESPAETQIKGSRRDAQAASKEASREEERVKLDRLKKSREAPSPPPMSPPDDLASERSFMLPARRAPGIGGLFGTVLGAAKSRSRPEVAEEFAPAAQAEVSSCAVAEPPSGREPFRIGRITAGESALAYGNLRMVGAKGAGARGCLKAQNAIEMSKRLERELPCEIAVGETLPAGAAAVSWEDAKHMLANLPMPPYAVALDNFAGHFALRYARESPGDVLADSQWHSVHVLTREGKIRQVFRCVPRVDDNVYRCVLFDNPLNLPLLAGPADVYRGGDFIVRSPLSTTPSGKCIDVSLGVEPGIRVARNTHFNERAAGLLGGEVALEHEIEIEVRSNLRQSALIEIFERVPVSREKDCKVEILRTSPAAESFDQKERGQLVEGGVKFALTLNPGERQMCVLEYRITISGKKILTGGNRRD